MSVLSTRSTFQPEPEAPVFKKLIIEVDLEIEGDLPANAEDMLLEDAGRRCGGAWIDTCQGDNPDGCQAFSQSVSIQLL